MDFSLSEEYRAIADLAQQIFRDKITDEYHLNIEKSGTKSTRGFDKELWQVLAESGLQGLALKEQWGGSELGMEELCAVFEAQGEVLAPVPLLPSVMAALVIQQFGSEELCGRVLPAFAAGENHLSFSFEDLARGELSQLPVATQQGDGWQLNGQVYNVAYAEGAAAIVVAARAESGDLVLVNVTADGQGVERVAQEGTNHEPRDVLKFSNATVAAADVLAAGEQAAEAIEWALQRIYTSMAALQTGISQEALKRTAEYLGDRKQFGRPLASFQALTHRAADGYIDIEALRTTVWQSAWRLSQGLDCTAQARSAKWWATETGHRVAQSAQHMHGGIGADLEYPIHRYFLWSKQNEFTLGGANQQLAELGALLANNENLGVSV